MILTGARTESCRPDSLQNISLVQMIPRHEQTPMIQNADYAGCPIDGGNYVVCTKKCVKVFGVGLAGVSDLEGCSEDEIRIVINNCPNGRQWVLGL